MKLASHLYIPILLGTILSTQAYHCLADSSLSQSASTTDRRLITGVLGLKWGDNAHTVKQTLIDKGYTLNPMSEDNPYIFDSNGNSVDEDSLFVVVVYVSPHGLAKIIMDYNAPADNDILAMFHRKEAELTSKYGPVDSTERTYYPPYKDGDGHKIEALRAGKARIFDYWNVHFAPRKPNTDQVILDIFSESYITHVEIEYQNDELMGK